MSELLVATRNLGKFRELKESLTDIPFCLLSLTDMGISTEVVESGATFEENASLKATTYASLSGMLTLADDSGLEVDALQGKPGIMSSRYAGDKSGDTERISLLLKNLAGVPLKSRNARFRTVIAIAWPGRPITLYTGECHGVITIEPKGGSGFGYDPIFFLPEVGRTMAELSPREKNRISHRGIAARKAAAALRKARQVTTCPGSAII